jgi:hypothetical protein
LLDGNLPSNYRGPRNGFLLICGAPERRSGAFQLTFTTVYVKVFSFSPFSCIFSSLGIFVQSWDFRNKILGFFKIQSGITDTV